MIYELITDAQYNDIYEKTNKDAEEILNDIDSINFAVSNNNIYNTTAKIHVNSIINSIYITGNSVNPILDLEKDRLKIIGMLTRIKNIKKYPILNLNGS